MKFVLRNLGFIIIAVVAIFGSSMSYFFDGFFADSSQVVSTGYSISSYDIDIVVGQDNVLSITETINADFTDLTKHGIVRALPIKQKVYYVDESGNTISKNYEISYSNILSSVSSSLDQDSNFIYLYLGSEYAYVESNEEYIISYKASLGDDRISDYDQFYFNVLGDNWDTTVLNFTCTVTLPQEVDIDIAKVYVGAIGEDALGTDLSVVGKVITYSRAATAAYTAITFRVVLPEGYFNVYKPGIWQDILALGVIVGLVVVGIVVFKKRNNIKDPVPSVEFEAPKGITPAEAGYIIDKFMNKSEISSLIVYWADKGFISIEDKGELTLVKLKEPDESFKDYEKDLFKAIFATADKTTLAQPNLGIAVAVDKAKKDIVSDDTKEYFEQKTLNMRNLFLIVFGLINALAFWFIGTRVFSSFDSLFVVFACTGAIALFGLMICYSKERVLTNKKLVTNLMIIIPSLLIIGVIVFGIVSNFEAYSDPLFLVIIAPIVSIAFVAMAYKTNYRTDKGNEVVGKLIGLRNFIMLAEKDRIKMLVKDDPSYFYHILPYAYVLGVSDTWIKKFETINMPVPSWYYGNGNFANFYIGYAILSSLNRTGSYFTTTVKPSNFNGKSGGFGGGGFSGGGFSGGGFGGGGGRSW